IREALEKTVSLRLRLNWSLDELRGVVNKRPGIADQRFEILRISDEQSPELLGSLEAEGPHFGPRDRVIPLPDELCFGNRGNRSLGFANADHHELTTDAVPERAVLKRIAERTQDGLRAHLRQPMQRQPV